ncbi:PorV/PorQ family protein [bacterium]|nr:PorV/PorQ family protein [bacterium]
MKSHALKTGVVLAAVLVAAASSQAQKPYRRGTTSGNFLEFGYGSAGNAMGDAATGLSDDLSAVYWNPSGLALMRQSGILFMMQPWIAGINSAFAAGGLVVPGLGTFGIGLLQVDYGREPVTTLEMQEGTGENYSAADYCISISYARKLAQWFAFGASAKMVSSRIWHCNATAFAMDLGVRVNTDFFSPTGERGDGLSIGMSISNYGTKMKFDGMDLLQPIDPDPYTSGEYDNVEGQYKTQAWELPLLFRIGMAIHPLVNSFSRLTIAADALHPNNNCESVNVGAQYEFNAHAFGTFYLRGGYKALFMSESYYGPSYGIGFIYRMPRANHMAIQVDYAYRDMDLLGSIHSYTFSFLF